MAVPPANHEIARFASAVLADVPLEEVLELDDRFRGRAEAQCVRPERGLRAVAAASEKATFGITSATRAARMKKRLREIQRLVSDPLIQPSLDAVAVVELRLGNRAAITAAADEVGRAAQEFAEKADGNPLSAIDSLLPQPGEYRN